MAMAKGSGGNKGIENLIPLNKRTPEERKRIASMAGKASVAKRRELKAWREVAGSILTTPLKGGKVDEKIKSLADAKGLNLTLQNAMILKQAVKAVNGDPKAVEILLSLTPDVGNEVNNEGQGQNMVDILDITIPHYDMATCDIKRHRHTHYWFSGGRGSTKSSYVSTQIPKGLIENPDTHAVVMRKVGNTLKNSVYQQIEWAIDKLGVSADFQFKKSPLEIIYKPTGQRILFLGVDDKQKIKSLKLPFGYVGFVWYEELDQFAGMNEIRNINQSLLRGGDKYWCFYSFNPPKSRDNWVNVEQLIDDPDRLVVHSDYTMVPPEWLGEQFINEAEKLRDLRPDLYAHEYLGEVTGTGGGVFNNVEDMRITDEMIDDFDNLHHGIDFGFATDPFVYDKLHYDVKKDIVYIFDEVYSTQLKNRDAYERIKDKVKTDAVYCDSAEPKSIAELSDLGLRAYGVKKGPDSRNFGIKWLADRYKIYIDKKRCPNTYREFVMYEYERDKDDNFISSYPKRNDHTIDAVRYALRKSMNGSNFSW